MIIENFVDFEERVTALKYIAERKNQESNLDNFREIQAKTIMLFNLMNDQEVLRCMDRKNGPEALIQIYEGKRRDFKDLSETIFWNVKNSSDEESPKLESRIFAMCTLNLKGSVMKKIFGSDADNKDRQLYINNKLKGYNITYIDKLDSGDYEVGAVRSLDASNFFKSHGDGVNRTIENVTIEINGAPLLPKR